MFSRAILFSALALLAMSRPLRAEETKLKVGVFDFPPLAMKDEDGHWSGLAVELWEEISTEAQLNYEYVEVPPEKIIGELSRGKIDLAVGELGVSAEREQVVDFTQSYLENTAAVAMLKSSRYPAMRELFVELSQHGIFQIIAVMFGALMIFSLLLWLIERTVHKGHFGGKPIHGFGSAIWFSAVTMTTVGYGDKTPQTLPGRILALLWMFFGIVLVSAFTGAVASSLTVARLNQSVEHLGDLAHFRNGVIVGSIAQNILGAAGIATETYPTLEAGLKAVDERQVGSLVSDNLTLRYLVANNYPDTMIVDKFPTARVSFAMATRPDLPQFQEINIALIEVTTSAEWQRAIDRWLGPAPSK